MSEMFEPHQTNVSPSSVFQIGAVVFILDRQGNLLMVNRLEDEGWSLPGCLLTPGESFDVSLRRAMELEIGLTLEEMVLLNVFSGPGFETCTADGGEIHHVRATYLARKVSGRIALNENRLRELRFFATWNLRVPVKALDQPLLLYFIQRFPGGQVQEAQDLSLMRPKNFWENPAK